jgi:hypothetical protein
MHCDLYFSPDAWGDQSKEGVIIWVHNTMGGNRNAVHEKVCWETGK